MDAPARAGDLGSRCVHDLFLRVIHHHHAGLHALTHHGAGGDRAVDVEQLDPIVIDDAGTPGVVFREPHAWTPAAQREHDQVVGVGRVDAPLLMRGDEVQSDLGIAVRLDALNAGRRFQVDRWPVAGESLAESAHPRVIHVELLPAGQRAPRNQLVYVGVAGVIGNRLALDAAPRGRADDLARLRLDVAKADLLIFAVDRQMRVGASGLLAQRLPGLHRHMAVGLGRQHQHHLGSVDVGLDLRHAAGDAFGDDEDIELAELLHFGLRVPGDALAAVADLVHQGAQRHEALIDVGVVALDHLHVRRGLARNQVAFATLPVLDFERLRQLRGAVVHQRDQNQVAFDSEMADADFAELLGEAFVDVPVAARLPCGIHRGRQRVYERVHVAGIEVVLLVPRGRGQHDVAVQAGRAHAEVERDQQVELAFGRLVVPDHFGGFGSPPGAGPSQAGCAPSGGGA